MKTNSDQNTTRQSLLVAVSNLDPAAWEEFARLYDPLLRAYVADYSRRYNLNLRDDDCDDVKQDVLVSLFRTLPAFQLDHAGKGRFRTWLWRVAHNATIDWVRKHRRRSGVLASLPASPEGESSEEQLPDPGPEPPGELIEEHVWQMRRQILAQVKEEMQSARKWDCFERHLLQNRPSAEVAGELGVSVSAVNTYTSRVLARVRELCRYYDVEL